VRLIYRLKHDGRDQFSSPSHDELQLEQHSRHNSGIRRYIMNTSLVELRGTELISGP